MRYKFATGEVIDVPDNLNLQGLLGYVWHIWHKGYSAGVAHVPFGGVKKEFSKITVIPFAGADIKDIANETIRMATLFHCPVEFDFNGVQMCVTHATDPENACNIYRAAARKPTASELRDKFAAENAVTEPAGTAPSSGKLGGFHLEGMDVVPNSAPEPKKCKICGEQTKMGICPNGNDYSTHHPDPRIRQMYEDLRNHKDILDGVKVDTPERGSLIRTTLSYDYLAGFRDGVREIKK